MSEGETIHKGSAPSRAVGVRLIMSTPAWSLGMDRGMRLLHKPREFLIDALSGHSQDYKLCSVASSSSVTDIPTQSADEMKVLGKLSYYPLLGKCSLGSDSTITIMCVMRAG